MSQALKQGKRERKLLDNYDLSHKYPTSLNVSRRCQKLLVTCFQVQHCRESLSWIRRTRTARQDARRSGKEDAWHSLFLEEDETLLKMHVNKKESSRDVSR